MKTKTIAALGMMAFLFSLLPACGGSAAIPGKPRVDDDDGGADCSTVAQTPVRMEWDLPDRWYDGAAVDPATITGNRLAIGTRSRVYDIVEDVPGGFNYQHEVVAELEEGQTYYAAVAATADRESDGTLVQSPYSDEICFEVGTARADLSRVSILQDFEYDPTPRARLLGFIRLTHRIKLTLTNTSDPRNGRLDETFTAVLEPKVEGVELKRATFEYGPLEPGQLDRTGYVEYQIENTDLNRTAVPLQLTILYGTDMVVFDHTLVVTPH